MTHVVERPAPHTRQRTPRGAPVFGMDVDQATRVLRVHGELDLATVGHFASAAAILVDGRVGDVTVDLTDLGFIDATGLGALVTLRNQLGRGGHRVVLQGVRPATRRVFDAAGLAELLPDLG